MIEYILVFLFIIFILINENKIKFYQIRFIYDNYNFIKFIIKNILYVTSITLYLIMIILQVMLKNLFKS